MTDFNRNSSHISLRHEIGYLCQHCHIKELPSSPGLLSFMTVILSAFWYLFAILGLSL